MKVCARILTDAFFVKQSSADDRQLLGIEASSMNNASGNKSVIFPPEDHYYDSNQCYALSKSDKNKLLKVCSGINVVNKAYKSGGQSKSDRGNNNGQGKCKSKIAILDNKIKEL